METKKKEYPSGEYVMIRLPKDVKEKIEEKAKENKVSRNDMVRMIIIDFFRRGGKLIL